VLGQHSFARASAPEQEGWQAPQAPGVRALSHHACARPVCPTPDLQIIPRAPQRSPPVGLATSPAANLSCCPVKSGPSLEAWKTRARILQPRLLRPCNQPRASSLVAEAPTAGPAKPKLTAKFTGRNPAGQANLCPTSRCSVKEKAAAFALGKRSTLVLDTPAGRCAASRSRRSRGVRARPGTPCRAAGGSARPQRPGWRPLRLRQRR